MLPHSKNVFVNKASGAQKWSLVLGRIPLHQKEKKSRVFVLNLLVEPDFWLDWCGTRSTILEFAARAQIANISK